jgi:hypothetical protein
MVEMGGVFVLEEVEKVLKLGEGLAELVDETGNPVFEEVADDCEQVLELFEGFTGLGVCGALVVEGLEEQFEDELELV